MGSSLCARKETILDNKTWPSWSVNGPKTSIALAGFGRRQSGLLTAVLCDGVGSVSAINRNAARNCHGLLFIQKTGQASIFFAYEVQLCRGVFVEIVRIFSLFRLHCY